MFFSVGSSVVWAGIVSVLYKLVTFGRVQKLQLKVKMCCLKCEEKVIEEIQEVPGVFNVRAERFASKVVVVEAPQGLDYHEVLKKARKVDKKAKFVDLDAKEKPKTEEQKKKAEKEAKEKKAKEEYEKMLKEHTAEMAKLYTWNPPPLTPLPYGRPGPYYIPQPEAYYPGDFFYSMLPPMVRLKEEEEKEKEKKKEEEKKKKEKEAEEKKKMQEAAAALPFVWTPIGWQRSGPYYAPQPYPYRPEEFQAYRLPEWYAPRYHYPPESFQPERDEFHQPYYYYN